MQIGILRYLFILLSGWLFINQAKGNNTPKLFNIQVESISYDSLISLLEKESGYHFSYFSEILPKKKISINQNNTHLERVLNKIFHQTEVAYTLYTGMVILHKKEIPKFRKITGQVFLLGSEEGIPYATIEIKGKYKGTIADKNGYFELMVDKENYNDSLLFSNLGHEIRVYPISHFSENGNYKIYLKKKFYNIETVTVGPEKLTYDKAGNYSGAPRGSLYLDTHGQQTAIYIENKKRQTGTLKGVKYYLSKKGNTTAPLRIHVYNADSVKNTPGNEILPRMVIVKPNIGKGWSYVNLHELAIEVPEKGIYIAIEGVFPDDYNEFYNDTYYENDFQDNRNQRKEHMLDEISYGQRIGYNLRGRNQTWHFSITKTWFQLDKKRFNVMIGADIIYKNIEQIKSNDHEK